ncbi:dienelactone hydrolase family protein [Homoserinimonas sp. OAct 916]|uniref:dienelactone hydrolase family protein n=1 Tax=Homoserinimonas sp. OAct 916 TaxID=2211450 RepID=UPI000DBE1833|nr:dienelactone hydrolase family protein [Homoserinimonas sp. OAct 916]
MTEIFLFHHAQGLTAGVHEFAAQLRTAGHTVTAPDLYEGKTFATLDAGVAHASEVGFDTLLERARQSVADAPNEVVYAGFSLGVVPAQMFAQTRPGAKGAVLMYSCLPVSEFGTEWPRGVPVQIHGKDADEYFAGDGDIEAARELVAQTEHAELFVYPGDEHLFADSSLSSYDDAAATLLMQRVIEFLDTIE